VDPIIPTPGNLEVALDVISSVTRECRVRISFLDAYPHVRERFAKAGLTSKILWDGLHAPLDLRNAALHDIEALTCRNIEVCGEPNMACAGCVSAIDIKALGFSQEIDPGMKGQRRACTCLAPKTELLQGRRPCPHGCLYCYWR
jgi:hypothetical protein